MFAAQSKISLGPMAQLGARLNGIEEVEGSNPSGSTVRNGRLAPSVLQVYNETKVRTGVVGHPVSEKGERGGSPSTVPAERHITLKGVIRSNSPVILSGVLSKAEVRSRRKTALMK